MKNPKKPGSTLKMKSKNLLESTSKSVRWFEKPEQTIIFEKFVDSVQKPKSSWYKNLLSVLHLS